MRLRGHAIKPPPLVRGYHTSSLIPDDASSLKDISSPHWSSEALVPQFDSKTRRVTSFKHSVEPSPLSVPFLKSRSLVHAANSVIGFTAEFKRGVFGVGAATGTAFEVGPGGTLHHSLGNGRTESSLLNAQSYPRRTFYWTGSWIPAYFQEWKTTPIDCSETT